MSKKSKVNFSQVIRSYIFAAIVPLYAIVYSFACVASWLFPLSVRFHLVIAWQRSVLWLLKVICRMEYRIEGLDNIPRDRVGVVLSKHQSAWETFILPGLFHNTAIILKRELLWIPFFGWGLATVDPIAINRSDRKSAMTQILEKGKKCLQAGRWILVFPEGTRIAPGHVGKYRLGGARIAVEAGCPVLPVAHNAGFYWQKRQLIKRPGTMHMVIGPLIETVGKTPEQVTQEVQDWIENTVKTLRA